MMIRRVLIAFLLAITVSAACTLLLARKLAKSRASLASLRYVTTSRDLEAGEVLTAADLHTIAWPSSNRLDGALSSSGDAVGRAVLNHLVAGQPILAKQLSAVGGLGLAARVPDGMRAVSLKTDQIVGVAGYLLPGTHVDVLVTCRQAGYEDAVTSTVLQDVQIIATGQKTQADPDGKASTADVVTLLVNPHDAERVVLASTQGSIHFVLRNGADQQELLTTPARLDSLGVRPAATAMQATFNQGANEHPLTARSRVAKQLHAQAAARNNADYRVVTVRGDKQTVDTF